VNTQKYKQTEFIISILSTIVFQNRMIQWVLQKALPSLANRAIGFEDMVYILTHPNKYVLINTLPATEQSILIRGTLTAREEEECINEILTKYSDHPRTIVLYGRNSCDDSPRKKHAQLLSLGINEVFIYIGGLFEWLLLQDVYGAADFPTVSSQSGAVDILAYRPKRKIDS
jgi:Rhodanese-like domain